MAELSESQPIGGMVEPSDSEPAGSCAAGTDGITPIRTALEFFSGIGGLHYAFMRAAHPDARMLTAFDVDDAAGRTYRHNFPDTRLSAADIASLKASDLEALAADAWLCSPPCQPHTRQGLQLGDSDRRSKALTHLVNLLDNGTEAMLPRALLLENVVGFESSSARGRLHAVLLRRGFSVREFWVSPCHVGVPNQRTRYFLLARRDCELAQPSDLLAPLLLDPATVAAACAREEPLVAPRGRVDASLQATCAPLAQFLGAVAASTETSETAVSEHILERYGRGFDLVGRASRRSTAFTKNYTRYFKGTGSVVCDGAGTAADGATGAGNDGSGAAELSANVPEQLPAEGDDKTLEVLRPLRPRFFTPREIANVHGFPQSFAFPPSVGRKKQYELLGNSLSVDVVAALLRYLLDDGATKPFNSDRTLANK